MASIRKRGNSYQIIVSVGRDRNDKKLIETTTWKPEPGMTEKQAMKEAEKAAIRFEDEINRKRGKGQAVDCKKLTIAQYYADWKTSDVEAELAETTLEVYCILIEKHLLPELGNIPIRKLETVQLNALYEKIKRRGYTTPGGEHREYSAATLKRIHSAVSKLLADAQEKQYISENPAIAAKVPKVKSAPVDIEAADLDTRHFTKEQAQAFLNYLEEVETPLQMRVLYHISVSCGLRVGETVALRWSDIDFEKGFVSITKSTARTKKGQVDKPPKSKRSRRKVQIPQSTLALLKKHKGEQKELCFSLGTAWEGERSEKDRRLFIQHGQHIGRQMHHDTPGKTFQKLIARYNKAYPDKALPELTQHGLRHTFASLLIAQGVDIVTVSAMLGHADATVTMRVYAHEIEDNKVMASNIMDEILTTVAV